MTDLNPQAVEAFARAFLGGPVSVTDPVFLSRVEDGLSSLVEGGWYVPREEYDELVMVSDGQRSVIIDEREGSQ